MSKLHCEFREGDPTIRRTFIDTYDFVPVPAAFLKKLGWGEGTALLVEMIDDTLLVTKAPVGPETLPTSKHKDTKI